MKTDYKRRRDSLNWVLAVAILAMAAGPSGAWHCIDGKSCPNGVPMFAAVQKSDNAQARDGERHCSNCAVPTAVAPSRGGTTADCSPNHCVLTISERPIASLTSRDGVVSDSSALLPDAPYSEHTIQFVRNAAPGIILNLRLVPQSHSPRAPPIPSLT